jgi:queuosine precursor transporter
MLNKVFIGLYLSAIILANLIITQFGPSASIVTAFIFIGLDLTTRDFLHETWQGNGIVWKMGLLIGSGSVFSYLLNRDTGQIAFASFAAFASAGIVDAFIYQLLKDKARLIKINGSNLVSSSVDSLIFPTLAFGGLMLWIVLGQFIVKVLGGFMWSLLLKNLALTKSSFEGINDSQNNRVLKKNNSKPQKI